MAAKQLWKCPTCGDTYRPAIPALEVLCGKPHMKGKRDMVLVEGDPVRPNRTESKNRTATKGSPHVASGKV